MTELIGGESLVIIDEEAFYNCTGITEFVVPATCETIGARCFSGVTAEITINPDSLTFIGESAFNASTIIWNSDSYSDWKVRFTYEYIRTWQYNGMEYYESSAYSNLTVYFKTRINSDNANSIYHNNPNYSSISESSNSNAVGKLIKGAVWCNGAWIRVQE